MTGPNSVVLFEQTLVCWLSNYYSEHTKQKASSRSCLYLPGGEAVSDAVLDVDDVEAPWVALTVGDETHTPQVTTAGDHAQIACRQKLSKYKTESLHNLIRFWFVITKMPI